MQEELRSVLKRAFPRTHARGAGWSIAELMSGGVVRARRPLALIASFSFAYVRASVVARKWQRWVLHGALSSSLVMAFYEVVEGGAGCAVVAAAVVICCGGGDCDGLLPTPPRVALWLFVLRGGRAFVMQLGFARCELDRCCGGE